MRTSLQHCSQLDKYGGYALTSRQEGIRRMQKLATAREIAMWSFAVCLQANSSNCQLSTASCEVHLQMASFLRGAYSLHGRPNSFREGCLTDVHRRTLPRTKHSSRRNWSASKCYGRKSQKAKCIRSGTLLDTCSQNI